MMNEQRDPNLELQEQTLNVGHGAASLVIKIIVCLVTTLTLLGGSLDTIFYPQPAPDVLWPSSEIASAQKPAPTPDDKPDRPTSNPYTGDLSIFEDPKRADRLQIERVMDVLKIKEGSNVADIGAGSGWFTVRAARRVGQGGKVYAVDINRDYLNYIEERAKRENLPNVQTILGKPDDATLPAKSADAVLILKTYHEIAEPIRLMKNLRASLREGALVGIIDRNGRGDDHGLDSAVVVRELQRAGYALVESYDFVKPDRMDYFLVFRVKN
jgi:SAM-dependent methyltransferase